MLSIAINGLSTLLLYREKINIFYHRFIDPFMYIIGLFVNAQYFITLFEYLSDNNFDLYTPTANSKHIIYF